MLLDVRHRAPAALYKPYVLTHNSLVELWNAADLIRGLPAICDEQGRISAEDRALATSRLSDVFGRVAENLQSGRELLAEVVEWFALGSERPPSSLRYRTFYHTAKVLRASTYHELIYDIAVAVVLDLSTLSSDPFSGLKNSDLGQMQDQDFLSESIVRLAAKKWHWPLADAVYKRHRRLEVQLRREFLRAWAQRPFEESTPGEFAADDWVPLEAPNPRVPCAQRDAYFLMLSENEGKGPSKIRELWNADKALRNRVSPNCSSLVTLDTVEQAIKRAKRKKRASSANDQPIG